jgi:hypothetical protein
MADMYEASDIRLARSAAVKVFWQHNELTGDKAHQ